jgi:uncharacterized protein YdeI (YjbR/CyaY-like superfamily)
MSTLNDKVNWFFEKETMWKNEYELLRLIVLGCDVVEELKWGCPCYTVNKTNVVLIHGFKDYCALLFHKGVLMKDEKKLLIQQTENVQAARQMRFSSWKEIEKLKKTIQAYIKEAITLEKSGAKVHLKTTAEYNMPVEFKKVLDEMNDVKKAFEALTPGRQRGYLYFFSQPKQAKTRESRIEKAVPNILKGKGIDD